jgi:hypothetical protein
MRFMLRSWLTLPALRQEAGVTEPAPVPDAAGGRATADALLLARQRLRGTLLKVMQLAGEGNVAAAREALQDAGSDLDGIQVLWERWDRLNEEDTGG